MNNNGFYLQSRSTGFCLTNIKKEERFVNYVKIFKDRKKKVSHLPDLTSHLRKSIDKFETNKRVQFSKNVTLPSQTNKTKQNNQIKQHSLPISNTIPDNNQQSKFFPTLYTTRINNSISTPITAESTLYRSENNRKFSFSSINSSSVTPTARSSFSSNSVIQRRRAPSIQSSSQINSTTNELRFSSLIFNSSLSLFDRQNLNDIRQIVPDQFEILIPTLIKLGIITFTNKLFQNNYQQEEQMTTKQLIEHHRLISLIKKDEENIQHKRYLEHLYGSISSRDNIHHQDQLLRETLSFKGQLALIDSYRDQIERELNNKIIFWKTIPIISIKKDSYTNKSSGILNCSIKSNEDFKLIIDEDSLQILIPDQIDKQWKIKLTSKIIEQQIILLDKVRLLSSKIFPHISSNEQCIQDTISDLNKLNLVKQFKEWIFLSSTLYAEDKHI